MENTTTIRGGIWLFVCLNYAAGYCINSRAAADLSGRLNWTSEMIACFEWKDDLHFYIYDSYSCFDVVGVEKTWHGWKTFDNCLNWPKWSIYDENVKMEVSCFEKTQIKEVRTGEVALFTFDAIMGQANVVKAIAYDAEGNPIYRLEEQGGLELWMTVTE